MAGNYGLNPNVPCGCHYHCNCNRPPSPPRYSPPPHYYACTPLPTSNVVVKNEYASSSPASGSSSRGEYYWANCRAFEALPQGAVMGGVDVDGQQIYVGRAYHNGDLIPAKVIPGKQGAFVCYNGQEHGKQVFQVLCQSTLIWVPSSNGRVPPGALEGGKTTSGETLYIGRVCHNGATTVGKVHPSHQCCYIPFGYKEHRYTNYEVLVSRR